VDGNAERVVARLFAVEEPMPKAKPRLRQLAAALVPERRPGDFAQALMDLGATICTPKRPACALCPWIEPCAARRLGLPETFPRRAAKKERPQRYGIAYLAERADGAVLLRRRPEKGLLGGMAEVPGSAWIASADEGALAEPPFDAAWRRLPGAVTHVFTHFALEITVFAARLPQETPAPESCWWARNLREEALPSVFRKVVAHGRADAPP
jgi:A/G-specific adenine glycosylase